MNEIQNHMQEREKKDDYRNAYVHCRRTGEDGKKCSENGSKHHADFQPESEGIEF